MFIIFPNKLVVMSSKKKQQNKGKNEDQLEKRQKEDNLKTGL